MFVRRPLQNNWGRVDTQMVFNMIIQMSELSYFTVLMQDPHLQNVL
jgi:hypothetical protein